MFRWVLLFLVAIIGISGAWFFLFGSSRTGPVPPQLACLVGAYTLDDGGLLVTYATEEPNELALLLPDGSRDTLKAAATAGEYSGEFATMKRRGCDVAAATFTLNANGIPKTATRVSFREQYVTFKSGNVQLAGKLVLPETGKVDQVVVWVAGSDDGGEVDRFHWQYTLPLRGVGSFVFDKRGTAGSGGDVSANFHIRASDVSAAVTEVRRLMVNAPVEVGVHGASQGGWVAPLGVVEARADFVIVSYGLAEGVPAEDRDENAMHLTDKGYGPDVLAKARQLTDITAKIVRSHWQHGWDELAQWRDVHGDEAWIKALPDTSYTGFLLKIPNFATGTIGPFLGPWLDKGISFDYDPLPTLRTLNVPQLWILGGQDRSAPSASTTNILRQLQQTGVPIDIVVFSDAGHGIRVPLSGSNPERKRIAPGYFDLVAEWSRTHVAPASSAANRTVVYSRSR
jgi:pimeloyl-ACP methyl ester carboxylesterase